jgi:hypothetical protein
MFGFCSCGWPWVFSLCLHFPLCRVLCYTWLSGFHHVNLSTHFTSTVCQARSVKLWRCQVATRVHFLKLLITWECEKGRTRHGVLDKSLMQFLKQCLEFSFVFSAPLRAIRNMFSARGTDMPFRLKNILKQTRASCRDHLSGALRWYEIGLVLRSWSYTQISWGKTLGTVENQIIQMPSPFQMKNPPIGSKFYCLIGSAEYLFFSNYFQHRPP